MFFTIFPDFVSYQIQQLYFMHTPKIKEHNYQQKKLIKKQKMQKDNNYKNILLAINNTLQKKINLEN